MISGRSTPNPVDPTHHAVDFSGDYKGWTRPLCPPRQVPGQHPAPAARRCPGSTAASSPPSAAAPAHVAAPIARTRAGRHRTRCTALAAAGHAIHPRGSAWPATIHQLSAASRPPAHRAGITPSAACPSGSGASSRTPRAWGSGFGCRRPWGGRIGRSSLTARYIGEALSWAADAPLMAAPGAGPQSAPDLPRRGSFPRPGLPDACNELGSPITQASCLQIEICRLLWSLTTRAFA